MALESSTNDYIVGRLANFTNTAEGSLLPPPQKGQFRVPFVSGLRVTQSTQGFRQTTFTLAWADIISNVPASQASTVDHYNIYYVIPGDGTGQPIGPYSARQSPAVLTVPFNGQAPVTFTVQTVLSNGMTSELTSSPTTTSMTNPTLLGAGDINIPQTFSGPNGTLTINNITWTNNTPTNEVTWSAGQVNYRGITYSIATGHTSSTFYIYWQLANPTIFQSASSSPALGVDDFIIAFNASNNSGTSGLYSPAFEIHNSNNDRSVLTPGLITHFNSSGNVTVSASRAANNTFGSLSVADGTGTGSLGGGKKIIATGNDGKIQMATLEINVGNTPGGNVYPNFIGMNAVGATAGTGADVPIQTAGYLIVEVNGTQQKIPFYNV